jgi:hypothetical protein
MIGHLLNRTLTVWRPETVVDDVGGQTVTFAQAGTVRAMVSQPTPAEQSIGDHQWGAELTHVVHALADADVRRGDELGGDLPSDVPASRRLRVLAVVRNSRETYTRASCEVTQAEVS